jgi:phosphoglycerate dehydrogenase-like enzyme
MKVVADTNIPFLKGVLEPFFEVVYMDGRSIDREAMHDADAVIIRTRTKCNEETLSGSRVQMIASATIGLDHIDVDWCQKHGIEVQNAEGCNAGGVADYVFSALYGISSRRAIKLNDAVIGIVGVGNVGKKVEQMARTLGIKVLLNDPPRAQAEGPEGFVDLDELLENATVVTMHVPLNDSTRGMANEDFFAKMRPGSIFINAARGEVVDEAALLHARPKLGALVLDTWCNEPTVNPNLIELCDIATPHIAGYSYQGKQNGTAMAVQAVARHFGIEALKDFRPVTEDPSLLPTELDLWGRSQGEIAAVMQYNYPIFTDDFLFRSSPDSFEKLRSEYNYRQEFYLDNHYNTMFSQTDQQQILDRGASLRQVKEQIEHFKSGFPWMKIVGPATPERGIKVLDPKAVKAAVDYYQKSEVHGKSKFVPASGAASRMFKDMFQGLADLEAGKDLPADAPGAKLAARIKDFAFYTEELFGTPEDSREYRLETLKKLLKEDGLAYGAKPKGVLCFHRYPEEVRTAIAEHLVEAQEYMRNSDGTCNLTITISPEHQSLFEIAIGAIKEAYEKKYGVKYNITFTFQDKATDTIAVTPDNKPFRKEDGTLLFRPAGHGALIYNLNKVTDELVSIKNIDNVAHEKLLPVTAQYKQVLMGVALQLRDKIFEYLHQLDANPSVQLCNQIESFLDKELCVQIPLAHSEEERMKMLRAKLNRPIRVCGMVRNEGEPGGGPYVIAGKDGCTSLQILESVQINKEDAGAMAAMSQATHFNPVDLVCCLNDYKGKHFDLLKYVDPEAGFMSSKSYEGRELKALELPGLWNGAMSDWNTLFVEVPIETFNPVKVVLDLLRPAHQG